MQRSIAGKSLHPVGLGCMNLSWAYGSPPSEEDAVKLLDATLKEESATDEALTGLADSSANEMAKAA